MPYYPAPTKPTKIVLPDGTKLSGDVALSQGNNVGITKKDNGGLFVASPPGPRRSLSVFAPGVIVARTLQKAIIPAPVLQQLDVYALTAAVGVTPAACGNVVVAGATSGAVTLPLSSAASEWHLGPSELALPIARETPDPAHLGSVATRCGVFLFTPTADLTIFNFDTWWTGNPPSGTGNGANPHVVRAGIADGIALGQRPTPANPTGGAGVGWVKGLDGVSQCFVDLDTDTINAGGAGAPKYLCTPPGVLGYKLLQGHQYGFVLMHLNANAAAFGGAYPSTNTPAGIGPAVTGNVTAGGMYYTNDTANAGAFDPFADAGGFGDLGAAFSLYGGIVGAALAGLVTVSTTLTGAPATPGSDIEIFAQF